MMSNSSSSWSLAGDFFALLIAVGYAASIVLVRRYHQIGMAPAACWGAIIAVLASLPFASPLSVTGHDFPILMLFGVGQLGGGLALFVTGVSMIPAANSALLGMIETVLGTLWVWLFFGEAPTPLVLAGGVLVLASIAINTVYGLRRRPASTMELGPVA